MSENYDGPQNGSRGDGGRGPGSDGASRILDDFSKLLTDAAGVAQGAKRDVESAVRGQAERVLDHFDVVQRDEFEAVKEMAARARTESTELRLEIDALKKQIEFLAKASPPQKATAKQSSAKKAPSKKAEVKKSTAKKA